MEKSLGILFFLRKPQPFRSGPWLVFLRITVDGITKELSLKRTWQKGKWKPKPGRATNRLQNVSLAGAVFPDNGIYSFMKAELREPEIPIIGKDKFRDKHSGWGQDSPK